MNRLTYRLGVLSDFVGLHGASARLYERGARRGHTMSQYNLGWAYNQGEGVKRDLKKAIHWFDKAASYGNASAAFNLGCIFKDDIGDFGVSQLWFRLAESEGHPRAAKEVQIRFPTDEIVNSVDAIIEEDDKPTRPIEVHDFQQIHVFTYRGFSQKEIVATIGNAIPSIRPDIPRNVRNHPRIVRITDHLRNVKITDIPGIQIQTYVYPIDEWHRIERFALEKLMEVGFIPTYTTQDNLGWSKSSAILVLSVFGLVEWQPWRR